MSPTAEPPAEELRVRSIMKAEVITVGEDVTVKELAQLFEKHGVSGAPVVDEQNRVIGMVTEGDLVALDADLHFPLYIQFLDSLIYLQSMHKFEERLRKAVGAYVRDVMTRDVFTVTPDSTVRQVATIMSRHKINRVPVVDDQGVLVGIVGRHEVLASIGL
ncbi:MAG: CBS domain-containing protein [Actinobacteria bacterium]|nr:CBS domain-containing protein [Actinomycetota bacterium]